MDVVRAFTYVFDDRKWLEKLAVTAIITALSLVLTPFVIGLLGWSALLGYQIELIRNVRLGAKNPLPRWDDFTRYVSGGANVLTAAVVYSLPNLVLGCTSAILAQNMGSGLIGSTLVLALSCCLFPLLMIYNLIMIPLLSLGMGRYLEDPRINVFFEFNFLWSTLRENLDRVLQFWLATIAADLVFLVLGAIPVIGWVVLVALIVPVYGMLAAQLSLELLGKLKENKPKNAPGPARR